MEIGAFMQNPGTDISTIPENGKFIIFIRRGVINGVRWSSRPLIGGRAIQ